MLQVNHACGLIELENTAKLKFAIPYGIVTKMRLQKILLQPPEVRHQKSVNQNNYKNIESLESFTYDFLQMLFTKSEQ